MCPIYTKLFTEPFGDGEIFYYLTEQVIFTEEGAFKRFGAMVESSGGERAQVTDIFGDRARTEQLIAKLRRGLVTPVTLVDVVYDEVCAAELAGV